MPRGRPNRKPGEVKLVGAGGDKLDWGYLLEQQADEIRKNLNLLYDSRAVIACGGNQKHLLKLYGLLKTMDSFIWAICEDYELEELVKWEKKCEKISEVKRDDFHDWSRAQQNIMQRRGLHSDRPVTLDWEQ